MMRLAILYVAAMAPAFAQMLPAGNELMEKVNSRDLGGDSELHLLLKFRDFRRGDHLREVDARRKSFPAGYRSVYRMTAPEHLVGISLMLDENRKTPGMWMYLPKADHLFPVVTRGLSALASDFSCEDLRLTFPLADYSFKTIGSGTMNGLPAYLVEMKPKTERLQSELGFQKSVGWILDRLWIVAAVDYFDIAGQVYKTLRTAAPEKIDGVWTVKHYTVTNQRAQHATDADVVSVRYHLQLPAATFQPEAMKAPQAR